MNKIKTRAFIANCIATSNDNLSRKDILSLLHQMDILMAVSYPALRETAGSFCGINWDNSGKEPIFPEFHSLFEEVQAFLNG